MVAFNCSMDYLKSFVVCLVLAQHAVLAYAYYGRFDKEHYLSSWRRLEFFAGREDKVTKLALIKTYESALIDAGKRVKLHVIEGGHEILMRSEVLNEAATVIDNYNKVLRQISR